MLSISTGSTLFPKRTVVFGYDRARFPHPELPSVSFYLPLFLSHPVSLLPHPVISCSHPVRDVFVFSFLIGSPLFHGFVLASDLPSLFAFNTIDALCPVSAVPPPKGQSRCRIRVPTLSDLTFHFHHRALRVLDALGPILDAVSRPAMVQHQADDPLLDLESEDG